MEKCRLNWFEKYALDIINRFGGIKPLVISLFCSFGFMGFFLMNNPNGAITPL